MSELIDFGALRNCGCGRVHTAATKVVLARGALAQLPAVIRECGLTGHALIACDENTRRAAGEKAAQILREAGIESRLVVLGGTHVSPDEAAVEALRVPAEGCGFLIAAGTGVIHDICRYLSHALGVPFVSLPTAASVDGFLSSVACMTFHEEKVTTPAHAPVACVADIDVIAAAPRRLASSGAGDIMGKYISLADWEISNLVTGEYYCEALDAMERRAVEIVAEKAGALRTGDADAIEALTGALLLSGLAIQLAGSSRPGSGAEHHLSHFWEAALLKLGRDVLHGEKVGVAAVLMTRIYRQAAQSPDFRPEPLPDACAQELERYGTGLCETVLKGMREHPHIAAGDVAQHWAEIRAIIGQLPTPERIQSLLRLAGAPVEPEELGVDRELLSLGLRCCPYMRVRTTFYSMLRGAV
ncbi:MAG: sn-glycerol-1-phosphate dehydrogenase [Clostridia bacterium]|nr:sn-glycerol-1-phosphate dehydrogenase [Clostridia bacterium]